MIESDRVGCHGDIEANRQEANSLAQFFLIDQSLQRVGGHHYDYVKCVAQAACENDYRVTMGVNRHCRSVPHLESFGEVRRLFRNTTYTRDSYLTGLRQLTRAHNRYLELFYRQQTGIRAIRDLTRRIRHERRRERIIRHFAADCERFFRSLALEEGDHVFFTTVNELEFMGLAAYLSLWPATFQANWHLQFHFNLFDGRTPEYGTQRHVLRVVHACFDSALRRVPFHRIQLYTTSESLADQYNRLGIGDFHVLAYPVSPHLMPTRNSQPGPPLKPLRIESVEDGSPSGPATPATTELPSNVASQSALRARPILITCPGELRREKGNLEHLQPLVNRIWDRHIATGHVRFSVQRPVRRWPRREKIKLTPPRPAPDDLEWITWHPHPLPDEEYAKLICDTDCGLLCYDSRAYFSRRAGVLGELLSLGKPVIVPAGSWLADQIQFPIFNHVRAMCRRFAHQTLFLNDVQWTPNNVPMAGGQIAFNGRRTPFEMQFEVPPSLIFDDDMHRAMGIHFDWHWPREHGVYARIEVEFRDADGEPLDTASQVVGHSRRDDGVAALFRIPRETASVRAVLTNAFHTSTANVRNLKIDLLHSPAPLPVGRVGIIAPDSQSLDAAIDELVQHFEHYRFSAGEFAQGWRRAHEPARTIQHLTRVDSLPSRRAG